MLHTLARLFGLRVTTKRQAQPTKQARPQLGVASLEDRWMPSTLQGINGLLTDSAVIGNPSPDEAQGKVKMQDIHFVKSMDKASSKLFLTDRK
jgi:hypothetical protein